MSDLLKPLFHNITIKMLNLVSYGVTHGTVCKTFVALMLEKLLVLFKLCIIICSWLKTEEKSSKIDLLV